MLEQCMHGFGIPGVDPKSCSTQALESKMPSKTSNRTAIAIPAANMLPEMSLPAGHHSRTHSDHSTYE